MASSVKPTALFWIIAVAALLWNIMGVGAYLGSHAITAEELIAAYGKDGAGAMLGKPAWATGAFAISVFAGLLGSLALILRKSWARILFVLSFIGVVIHNVWNVMINAFQYVGTADKVLTAVVLVVCIFLIWFAHSNTNKGVLS